MLVKTLWMFVPTVKFSLAGLRRTVEERQAAYQVIAGEFSGDGGEGPPHWTSAGKHFVFGHPTIFKSNQSWFFDRDSGLPWALEVET